MRRTDNVIYEQNIRAAWAASDESVNRAKMYIDSVWVKRLMLRDFDTISKVQVMDSSIRTYDIFKEKLVDAIDAMRSHTKIKEVLNLLDEGESEEAFRKLFK